MTSDSTDRGHPSRTQIDALDLPRHVLDALLEGCQVISPEFRYIYLNEAAAAQGRSTKARLLGRTMMEAYPGIENTEMFSVLRTCLGDRTARQIENEFVFPDGSSGWFELRFEPVPEGVAVLSIDISARRRTEAALRRSTRALLTLSECNQTLVRATDERRFMEDVCRTAVERGGYRMAWIGLKREDLDDTVLPVAQWGFDEGYTSLASVVWSDTERGAGPTGRAVRTGRPCVTHSVAGDAEYEPWRESALARGYASCVALPIRSNDETVGAITIYADEPDAFDEAELSLLDEMALDLGYGVETLRARDAQRTLLGNLPGMAYRRRSDRNRTLELVSGGCVELTGHRAEVLLRDSGGPYADLVHPEDRARVRDEVELALAAGKGYVVEYRIVTAGGDVKWVWEKCTVTLGADGSVEALDGFVSDITERKRAEQTADRLNDRLLRLTRVVQDLSGARSLDAVTGIVRRAARDLTGCAGATFVLRDGDLCHYVDEDAIAPLWKGQTRLMSECISGWAMIHGQAVVIEDIYADDRVAHDAYRPTFVKSLLMVPIRGADPIGAIGCYWDRCHHATEEDVRIVRALADSTSVALENIRVLGVLEESGARIRAIYDHLPTATFVWRRRGESFVLADFNEVARAGTAGQAQALLGKRPRALRVGFPGIEEDLALCFERRSPVRREVEGAMPGATDLRWLVLTYGFVPSDTVILHAEDVTDRRRTREQLESSQRLEAVGRLAGGIAHDFNNLLSVIISYSDFALSALAEVDPARADIAEVRKAGVRAATLTRQLLAFSRKQILELSVLDLNDVVRGIEGLLRRLLGENVEIVVRLAGEIGSVEADPGQIEQVIMNLALNARDAMPQGGRLTIETDNAELDESYGDRHGELETGRFVVLSIADTGGGMDAATQEHIFEPFFTTKEKGRGTGLGLATVYGIVKQSGGNIWFYSEPGRGSIFKVYLPRVDAPATRTERPGDERAFAGTETVLVVEDEDAVRTLAERVLQTAGYRALSAIDGGDALRLWESCGGGVDLLLTDVVMPGMSGRELAGRLMELRPGLKVLYMSGYPDDAVANHGVLDPGARLVGKPFSSADLTRAVREVLDGSRGSAQVRDRPS